MAGWVKLWRQLKDNGHLKMPGTAFKLWIYCLLEAAPYPNRARALEVGELWLNYEHVRRVIGETGRQMSKSTISNALKYLEQNGYLKPQVKKFYRVKACVVNWQEYQSSTETVPDPVPARTPEPYSGAASKAPKNIKNKDLYIDTAAAAMAHDFEKEFGRPLSPLEVS